ncbi:MAG: response regulator transcription factor [Acidobacteria bacterium]|nr:response regulator transcription factor [Acidobacteriota bacterium]
MHTDEPIRVVIIEDDRTTREGLGMLINGTPGYQCVGTFRSVEEALRLLNLNLPDVILLDIHLPGMLGSEGVRVLKERFPSLQIVMLTIYDEEDKVFESICNGACGYLLKKTPPVRLLEAIRDAHDGGSPMTPEIARQVVTLFQKTGPPQKLEHRLTPQEIRVLESLSKRSTYQAIADQLKISISTVRKYICSIYDKLHVHSKSEAVSKALKSRII